MDCWIVYDFKIIIWNLGDNFVDKIPPLLTDCVFLLPKYKHRSLKHFPYMNRVASLSAEGTHVLGFGAAPKHWNQPPPCSLRISSIRKCLQQSIRNKNGFIHYLDLGYNTDKTYKCQTEFLNLHPRVLFKKKKTHTHII